MRDSLTIDLIVCYGNRQSGTCSINREKRPQRKIQAELLSLNEYKLNIEGVPFGVVDWDTISETRHSGKSGEALWRTVEVGNIRVRIVKYSPGYVADHWCSRGHVLYVLKGELITQLKSGELHVLKEGLSYHVSNDDKNPHMSRTDLGATLFIVD